MNRDNFAAFFKANRGPKIDSILQPNYVNSKLCRTSSVSTLPHLNLELGKIFDGLPKTIQYKPAYIPSLKRT